MRGRMLTVALVLGWVVAVGMAPAFATAQDAGPGTWGEGLTITPNTGTGLLGTGVASYSVEFAGGAFIPEEEFPESMVVKVQSGTFAFRAQSDVLIDPQGSGLVILEPVPAIPVGYLPSPQQQYNDTGTTVSGCAGMAPHTLCLVNPAILGANYVQLEPGFLVYLPNSTTCFFCNTESIGGAAELLVWASTSPTGFSWLNRWRENASLVGTPVAAGAGATRGWMRLNPGSPCH